MEEKVLVWVQGTVHGVEIISALPLEPYVPSSDITVNLGHIAQTANIGRLGSVSFRRYTQHPDYAAPSIAGTHTDGTAVSSVVVSAARTKRIEPSLEPLGQSGPGTVKGVGDIKINFGHEELQDVNAGDAQVWAQYLNTAVGKGLRGSRGIASLPGIP